MSLVNFFFVGYRKIGHFITQPLCIIIYSLNKNIVEILLLLFFLTSLSISFFILVFQVEFFLIFFLHLQFSILKLCFLLLLFFQSIYFILTIQIRHILLFLSFLPTNTFVILQILFQWLFFISPFFFIILVLLQKLIIYNSIPLLIIISGVSLFFAFVSEIIFFFISRNGFVLGFLLLFCFFPIFFSSLSFLFYYISLFY